MTFTLVNHLLTVFLLVVPTFYLLVLGYLLKKELLASVVPIGALVLLSVIFLNKLLFCNQTLAQKDFNNIQVPMFQFFHDSITTFFLPPIWDSSFSGGFDAFASPLSAFFSVFNWVFLIGNNIYQAFNIFILCQLVLCSVSSYLMLRKFRFSKPASMLGAVMYTFNGYVVMRLSPGVGIEYVFAYKWLPLILLFTNKLLWERKITHLAGLAICLALVFEGNLNQVIGVGLIWLVYLLVAYKKAGLVLQKLVCATCLSFLLYAVKLVPFLNLVAVGVSRFSGKTDGWRQGNIDWEMFPRILFPIHFNYANAVFTPGVIGITLALLGLVAALFSLARIRKEPFYGFYFTIITLILAFILTIEGPLYNFLFSLPVLSSLTQIPTLLVFYIVPVVFLAAFAVDKLLIRLRLLHPLSRLGAGLVLVIYALPVIVFTEVLLGPSTFGSNTYSFNFPKMDIDEAADFPHYRLLSKQPTGLFVVMDATNAGVFFYPYGVTQTHLKTLQGYKYYFGSLSGDALLNAGLPEIKKRVDYIFTLTPLGDDPELNLVDSVSTSEIVGYKSHAVFENLQDYLSLYNTGWDDTVYLYQVACVTNCALKNISNNPVEFSVKTDRIGDPRYLTTSIAYSRWLGVTNGTTALAIKSDEFGYTLVDVGTTAAGASLYFKYINPFIYAGFALSLCGLVVLCYLVIILHTEEDTPPPNR